MAQVDSTNPNDPNNPNNQTANVNQPGQQTNQPATTGGGAGPVTSTGAGNVTGQVVGTNNPSQPFQNISSYLAANDPQSKTLASQVAGTVSAPINDAQSGITNAANTFTGAVNAGYTPENKDLTTAVSQNPAYVVAENPDNITNFQAQLNNKYTGPTDFTQGQGYSDLQGKIAAAQSQAANTGSESGIQSLLKSVEGPTTAGINKLDSLLLSANPENYKTIQDAGAGAAGLTPTLNQTAAEQNALAGQGATNASSSAAAAAAALQQALSGEKTNLSTQQQTLEGIVNQYNKSVGIINPVTQTIAQAIQDYLSANPNLHLSDATSALAPLTNLKSLEMPTESTYASPYDYQTIAALAKLGLNANDLAGLPITADTANLAQTFQLPQELQNAVGKAPGVESALTQELNALGGQISSAYQPFGDLKAKEDAGWPIYLQNQKDLVQLKGQLSATQPAITDPNTGSQTANPAYAALQKQVADKQNAINAFAGENNNAKSDLASMAQGLQWLDPASKGYNDLIAQINSELGKLGEVGVPTLNYAANTLTDPVSGAPIGQVASKDIGKAANLAALGATGAAGVGAGLAEAGGAAGFGLAAGTTGESIAAGLQGAGTIAGPAALAAYGASNIAQNSIAHPIESGLATLANTGLSLATLSLPPAVFNSIGKELGSVLNSIGNFFGGLF